MSNQPPLGCSVSDPREPPVSPALSPEEWATILQGKQVRRPNHFELFMDEVWGVVVGNTGVAVPGIHDAERHALAALALYGQPFGFTREDVDLVMEMMFNLSPIIRDPAFDADARSLASRITALLPPLSGPEETK